MKSKPFLIAIAAFAVTATGVQAYGSTELLEKAGLSEKQINAFETAREKREAGDVEGARDVLVDAGIDETVLHSVHEASREARDAVHSAIVQADYTAFKEAVNDSPFAAKIDSEEKFNRLVKAHTLREAGNTSESEAILKELNIHPPHKRGVGIHRGLHKKDFSSELSSEQREAFRVAHEANDRETMEAILDEAGVNISAHRMGQR